MPGEGQDSEDAPLWLATRKPTPEFGRNAFRISLAQLPADVGSLVDMSG